MKLLNAAAAACSMALLAAIAAPSARSDVWDRKMAFTFGSPVEIPRLQLTSRGVLPAGTYVFKVLDSQSERHIVQVCNKDETTIYATISAIPNFRSKVTDRSVITFREHAAGQPEALRARFYPGRNWGEEFVYPKAKALTIAKATNQPVLFTPVELVEASEPAKTADARAVTELKRAPIMAVTPAGEEVLLTQVVMTPMPEEIEAAAALLAKTAPVAPSANEGQLRRLLLIGILILSGVIALQRTSNGVR
ncbi:MAG TPA: hypothetical protein VFQ91_22130 [Bryobacteraceae bacterium]|nr:hypothetical protein [Bryobacteraceae bacterium]